MTVSLAYIPMFQPNPLIPGTDVLIEGIMELRRNRMEKGSLHKNRDRPNFGMNKKNRLINMVIIIQKCKYLAEKQFAFLDQK